MSRKKNIFLRLNLFINKKNKNYKKMKFNLEMFVSVALAFLVAMLIHDTIGKKITDKVNESLNK